ncbi:MAG: magnesium-translocating P-type ATPase [Candidatus Aenigmarchaeota archaeon]|nr:magnesium-translocating P-type ATPase [Candidatus Aenigmarchaeota archaeon]
MEWWTKTSEEVIKILNSSPEGISDEELEKRLNIYGLNDIPKRLENSALKLFLSQFKDPLLILLLVAALIAYFTESVIEAIIITSILIMNSLLSFFQEYKSELALRKLCKYIRYYAKVLRNGNLVKIDTRYIVPGDIVIIETGDRVPADLRLIEADELEIDESLVTGEFYPVVKDTAPIHKKRVEPQSMKNMAFMGTLVKNGKGKGIVVSTGMKSTFGKIAGYLRAEEDLTSYQRNIRKLSRFLMTLVIMGLIFIFIINSIIGKEVFDVFLFSLALAVGIVPEALPIIITIGLSRGAMKMTSVGVITKKLAAIEDLGNMDILCIDKTGTLTQNKIKLVDYMNLDYNKDEEIVILASTALSVIEKKGRFIGNSIDVAIGEFARKISKKTSYEIIDTIPFDYTRKRMSSIIKHEKDYLLICKGAPESVISVCSKMKKHNKVFKIDKSFAERMLINLFEKGYRVIAVAEKSIKKKEKYSKEDEKDLTLLGFLCFTDPPKSGVKQTIDKLKEMGIEIKILTGDNAIIAKKVMEDVGIEVKGVLSGVEIDAMDDESLVKAVERNNLFVRLTPEIKVRIVNALKRNGHVVGFLGDGANDAPAIRYADVGISVENGVDVAKEASHIILTRKSLKVILEGILEGRKTFCNTTKYIINTLSANLGNMTSLAIVSPFLDFLPMLPSQILLTNLITDGPLLSISGDNVDEEDLRKPKHWNINFIRKFCVIFGIISSIFDFTTMCTLILIGTSIEVFRTGWFLESVLSEILITFAIRTRKRFYKSKPGKILILSSAIFGLLTFVIIYSPVGNFFDFISLEFQFLLTIVLILITYFFIVEICKEILYKKIFE